MKKTNDFASGLNSLEEIIRNMETGNLTLEEMLDHYSRGIGLLKACKEQLETAEGKVEELTKELVEAGLKEKANE